MDASCGWSGCHDHSARKENGSSDLNRQMFNESENLDARAKEQFVIHMSESVDVHFTIAETTWICQEWAEIWAFQESRIMVPQFRCSAISIQRSVRFPNLSFTRF